ncbi:bZIP transcription factor TGA10-like [Pyrus x bretschneideri]|uniref:bZIP transcription factor TGA10-like n=1 Tax=Pyrus x bretschneideri TaxID=225117 RepID=UPI00202EF318|nr:bZIP transcription factor TGA10-like [Pyrus x bretschneideri]
MGFSRGFDFGGGGGQEEENKRDHPLLETKLLASSARPTSTSSSFLMASSIQGNSNQLEHQQQHHHQIQDQHHQHHQQQQQQIQYGMMQSSSANIPAGNFISNKDGGAAYDLGELDQALFLYLDGQSQDHHNPSANHIHHQDQRHLHQNNSSSGMRPPTLNIFPSQPMHVEPSSSTKAAGTGLVSPSSSGSKRPSEPSMELANPRNDSTAPPPPSGPSHEPAKAIKREGNRKGPTTSSSEQEGPKTPDPKTLRRLAQNREAARKSRLRKKAYVQQLETSRIKLTQLEQELQRARSQGMFFGGGLVGGEQQSLPVGINNISPDAAVFDMEYARWLEEHHRLMCELRAAVQEHLQENELRLYVDNCLAHYDEVLNLKGMVAKTDVFHIVSGMWKTPAERCFMWMGGFRPSEVIKIILNQIEPLTEQQLLGICGLQQSTQETEEALSQGLEALNQSLSETITSDSLSCPPNMANYMGQMAIAMNKLSTLEGFVRQADNLRQQTIHRLQQILTTRQAARCLLAIAEYFHRLRALSSLWMGRPRQDQS